MRENHYKISHLAQRKITSFYYNVAKKYRHKLWWIQHSFQGIIQSGEVC